MIRTQFGYGTIERRYITEAGPMLVVRVKTPRGKRIVTVPAQKS